VVVDVVDSAVELVSTDVVDDPDVDELVVNGAPVAGLVVEAGSPQAAIRSRTGRSLLTGTRVGRLPDLAEVGPWCARAAR
jgi:hypothetical protein